MKRYGYKIFVQFAISIFSRYNMFQVINLFVMEDLMGELVLAGVLVIAHCLIYIMCGTVFLNSIKSTRYSLVNSLISGFFVYHGVFQFVTLPCTLLKLPLSLVVNIWSVVVVLLIIFCVVRYSKVILTAILRLFSKENITDIWTYIFFGFIAFEIIVVCMDQYQSFDSAYYIGNVNTMLYTDRMYLHDPYTGFETGVLSYRYALASLSTHSAVVCRWFPISPLVEMRITVGVIDVILANVVVYLIGRTIFTEKYMAKILGTINIILGIFFNPIYSPSAFLLNRGYEGKAFCANVVIPMTLLVCIWICKDVENKENWKWLFAITLAANTISMSCMLIVPAIVVICCSVAVILSKKYKHFARLLVCLVPCVIIVALFASQYLVTEVTALW